ncbi:hypothetical protein [Photobacterium lipolyticum]|uniref:Uncharacterized protein n=1 Tax=Photobacterium lipolyticum TaxID=266810 RepID=A0A2T3N1K3_9GAMM|nr:hypothetical protein [Photobacterium lipolyticum]PSW06176.1 hypothetical protein C9I89_06615 [Photobacterium lipolyticum]
MKEKYSLPSLWGHHLQYVTIAAFLLMIGALSGCASTIDPKPFFQLQASSVALRDNTDATMNVLVPQTIDRYKRNAQLSEDGKDIKAIRDAHTIQILRKEYLTLVKVPSYLRYEQFKVGIWEMNNTMVGYTTLLHALATKQIMTETEFKTITQDLNASAFSTYVAFHPDASDRSTENTAILSGFAAGAFHAYLDNQQKTKLIKAIEDNQAQVELFSSHLISGIWIIEEAFHREYSDSIKSLKDQLLTNKSKDAQSKTIQSWMDLNRDYFAHIESLKALRNAALAFPLAHKELKVAVESPEQPLAYAISMVNYGTQLKSIVESAQKENKKSILDTELLPIEARAVALENEAKEATHAYSLAYAEAVWTRNESDKDAGNAEIKAKAEQLEKTADKLKIDADKKADAAKKMREAVETVKTSTFI